MKQGTITSIAATLAQELARTVEAAEKEGAAQINDFVGCVESAMILRNERQEDIDAKRKEAANLLAESLKMEEDANEEFTVAMSLNVKSLKQASAQKIADVAKLKLISNRKAA